MPLFSCSQAAKKSEYEKELLDKHDTSVRMVLSQLRAPSRLFYCRRAPSVRLALREFARSAWRGRFPWQGQLTGAGDRVPVWLVCWAWQTHYGITVCFRTLLQRLTAHLVSIWCSSCLGAQHRCAHVAGVEKCCDPEVRDTSELVVNKAGIAWEMN